MQGALNLLRFQINRLAHRERLLFDHVPKTGGLAISRALKRALPDLVSPHIDAIATDLTAIDMRQWPHIAGHFGAAFRHAVPGFDRRLSATIIREPISLVVSSYCFWRYNVAKYRPDPRVDAAKGMSFSDFIRSGDGAILNMQSQWLLGDMPACNPEAAAKEALAPYKVVGVTDEVEGFLALLLKRISPQRLSRRAHDLLAEVPSNASKQRIEPTRDDVQFLKVNLSYDLALYEEARRRWLPYAKRLEVRRPYLL